jgi:hypothetical protein
MNRKGLDLQRSHAKSTALAVDWQWTTRDPNWLLIGHLACQYANMINLTSHRTESMTLPPANAWLLRGCMPARSWPEMWMRERLEVLETLGEQAVTRSAESSKRIKAVTRSASPQLVKKVLQSMKRAGAVSSTGVGRGALWEVIR